MIVKSCHHLGSIIAYSFLIAMEEREKNMLHVKEKMNVDMITNKQTNK